MVKKVTKSKIIEQYLRDYSKMYYLRELAEIVGKSHQTIKPYAEALVKERILVKNERKNIIEYGLNFKHKGVYDYLVIAEKEKLMERLNKDQTLNVLYEKLSHLFDKNIFVMFGSAVKELKNGSDIDLLIIGKRNVNKIIKEFEDVYNKKLHKVQIDNLKKLSPALIREIYKKHLIFNNTELIVRFFGGLHEQNKLV